ncbi:hypothetical protein TWF594_002476 [Orbilia oligospora]|nr:hypothetical protein TWF706_009118 [Orbilia oligospora]KAF3123257.1 hypothetical protein TWF594_002476 [Orbilia oligospora]
MEESIKSLQRVGQDGVKIWDTAVFLQVKLERSQMLKQGNLEIPSPDEILRGNVGNNSAPVVLAKASIDSLLRHFARVCNHTQGKLASGGRKDIMDQIQPGLVLAAVIGAQGSRDIAWTLGFEAHPLVSSLGPVGLRSQADSSASYTEKVTPDRTMQVSPNFFPANWPTELNKLYNFKTDDKRADSPWPLEA